MLATLVLLTSLTEFMAQQVADRVGEGMDREPHPEQETCIRAIASTSSISIGVFSQIDLCQTWQQEPDYAPCRQQAVGAIFRALPELESRQPGRAGVSTAGHVLCVAIEPPTAEISAAEPTDSVAGLAPATPEVELQRGRRECNRLRFKAMLSDDPALRQQRDQVCAEQPR